MFDVEMRIAFLEDQYETLNREIIMLHRDNHKLKKELLALANLIRPMIEQESNISRNVESDMPPHY